MDIEHNKLTEWNWVVSHPEGFRLGDNVDIGAFTYIQAEYGVTIEDDAQIGGGCHIYSKNTINNTQGPIVLKKGCNIGAHCVILPNTTVLEGVLIKAGSIIGGNIYHKHNIYYDSSELLGWEGYF